ncbi:response regulator, partial [Pseudoalteromonas sp. S1688]|uniref:response regulator n=1 Tax=Pseudoalteromonas sp. S1688 TaxID=579511 RepID=UPI00110A9253
ITWIMSAEQSIHVLSNNEHYIFLLDYRLGASDGLSVLKQAIKNCFCGPIFMISGHSYVALVSAGLAAGAVDLIVICHICGSGLTTSF